MYQFEQHYICQLNSVIPNRRPSPVRNLLLAGYKDLPCDPLCPLC
jgi:hypothetical protein